MSDIIFKMVLLLMITVFLSWMISLYYYGDVKRFSVIDVKERITLTAWLFFVIVGIGEFILILMVE